MAKMRPAQEIFVKGYAVVNLLVFFMMLVGFPVEASASRKDLSLIGDRVIREVTPGFKRVADNISRQLESRSSGNNRSEEKAAIKSLAGQTQSGPSVTSQAEQDRGRPAANSRYNEYLSPTLLRNSGLNPDDVLAAVDLGIFVYEGLTGKTKGDIPIHDIRWNRELTGYDVLDAQLRLMESMREDFSDALRRAWVITDPGTDYTKASVIVAADGTKTIEGGYKAHDPRGMTMLLSYYARLAAAIEAKGWSAKTDEEVGPIGLFDVVLADAGIMRAEVIDFFSEQGIFKQSHFFSDKDYYEPNSDVYELNWQGDIVTIDDLNNKLEAISDDAFACIDTGDSSIEDLKDGIRKLWVVSDPHADYNYAEVIKDPDGEKHVVGGNKFLRCGTIYMKKIRQFQEEIKKILTAKSIVGPICRNIVEKHRGCSYSLLMRLIDDLVNAVGDSRYVRRLAAKKLGLCGIQSDIWDDLGVLVLEGDRELEPWGDDLAAFYNVLESVPAEMRPPLVLLAEENQSWGGRTYGSGVIAIAPVVTPQQYAGRLSHEILHYMEWRDIIPPDKSDEFDLLWQNPGMI